MSGVGELMLIDVGVTQNVSAEFVHAMALPISVSDPPKPSTITDPFTPKVLALHSVRLKMSLAVPPRSDNGVSELGTL